MIVACSSCGGANRATSDFQVRELSTGTVLETKPTMAEARIWVAQNGNGRALTIKAVPKAR